MSDVAGNYERIRERVARAAGAGGRVPDAVRIVAAAKAQPIERVQQAIRAGVTDIGENYVQEAAATIACIDAPITWHMIGHLQRNKAGRALELFQVIHTLDSVALADALTRQAEQRGRVIRVLIEVNIGGEASKHGVAPDAVEPLLAALADRRWLTVEGLMTIPPPGPSAEDSRPYFRRLRELRDRLQKQVPGNAPLRELSMGMSDDFVVAVEEGATMVRIGRAIFGERVASQIQR